MGEGSDPFPLRRKNGGREMKIIDGHMHTKGAPGRWFADCADARGYEAYAVLSLSCMQAYGGDRNNEECLGGKARGPRARTSLPGSCTPARTRSSTSGAGSTAARTA